jgi:hypothetical protein
VKSKPPASYDQPPSALWPARLNTGGYKVEAVPLIRKGHEVLVPGQIWAYTARVYPTNLLSQLPRLLTAMNVPPTSPCGAP